ncbi:MAG: Peptidase M16 inactive domain protein [Methanomassiliicoccales archaeon PtaB.Bin134]|jgi:predicted Zn-dependent peptidase|nr:MAG: Peptidase M16 inactive domain protein [Methanomassiliicoccales archaeon PtaB.Bin134]
MEKGPTLQRTSSGIPVIVEELPRSRTAALSVNYRVGSRDESPEMCGAAHFLEHIMFKGTRLRNAKQFSEMVEGAGGEMNAYTTKESTSFHVFSLDETFEVMKGLMADMMTSPLIDEEHVELERGVVLQEISMLEDDPEDYCRVLLDRSIWEGNPMANIETGRPECVSELKARDLRHFFEQHYRPPNMCVVACGNVSARDVLEWAEGNFDGLPRAPMSDGREPPVPRACTKVFPRKGDQAYVEVGFPGLPGSHPDRKALTVACIIMGGGTSSRLYQTVREDRGLVYHISMYPQSYTDCGIVDTFFSASIGNLVPVMRTVSEEISRFKDQGPTAEEVQRAKRWIKGMLVRKLEGTDSRLYWQGEHYMIYGELADSERVLAEFERVNAEDVIRVSNEIFMRKNMCVAMLAPEKEGELAARRMQSLDF